MALRLSGLQLKIPGGATAYRGYSAVRFSSPYKAQCAAPLRLRGVDLGKHLLREVQRGVRRR